jgi:hypothetical protein
VAQKGIQLISWFKELRRRKRVPKPHNYITTWELFRRYLASKLPVPKESVVDYNANLLNSAPANLQINYIAIVIDGKVEEVMRAQNKMAAMLLSSPTFVEFDPNEIYPIIGQTEYVNGKLVNSIVEKESNV